MIRFEVVKVSPDLARQWLEADEERVGIQRRVSPVRVQNYASLMRAGEWLLTHQAVAFDEEGELLDGQHRIRAVIEADTHVEMAVAYGVQRAAFDVIDIGYRRTAGSFLNGAGMVNGNNIAAGARAVLLYGAREDLPRSWSSPEARQRFSVHSVVSEVLADEARYRAAQVFASRLNSACNAHFSSVISGTVLIARHSKRAKKLQREFQEDLLSGAELSEGDPVLTYRNRMIRRKSSPPQSTFIADWQRYLEEYIRVWNAYVSDESVNLVLIRPKDAIPTIL